MCIRNVCFITENEYTMVYSVMHQGIHFPHIKKINIVIIQGDI